MTDPWDERYIYLQYMNVWCLYIFLGSNVRKKYHPQSQLVPLGIPQGPTLGRSRSPDLLYHPFRPWSNADVPPSNLREFGCRNTRPWWLPTGSLKRSTLKKTGKLTAGNPKSDSLGRCCYFQVPAGGFRGWYTWKEIKTHFRSGTMKKKQNTSS